MRDQGFQIHLPFRQESHGAFPRAPNIAVGADDAQFLHHDVVEVGLDGAAVDAHRNQRAFLAHRLPAHRKRSGAAGVLVDSVDAAPAAHLLHHVHQVFLLHVDDALSSQAAPALQPGGVARQTARMFPPVRPNLDPRPPEGLARVAAVQENWTDEEWRLYLATYYLLIENTDWMVGLALDAVKRAGLDRDTLVLFTSDHGDQMGAHGLVGKGVFYEECMLVPFAISWPGTVKQGKAIRNELISGTDVLPTLCDFAGLRMPSGPRRQEPTAVARRSRLGMA